MSQHDLVIDNATYPSVRADVTAALQALGSTSKGNARPATPYAGQLWIDDNTPSTTVWTVFVWTGSADIKLGELNTTSNQFVPWANAASVLASPAFTGNPTAPTPAAGDNDTSLATTAFVAASFAPLASPAFTGNPTAPTQALGDNDTSVATTAFVQAALASAGGKDKADGEFAMGTSTTTYANSLSFSRTATGQVTVTLSPSFADAFYDVEVTCLSNTLNAVAARNIAKSAGSFTLDLKDVFTNALTDVTFNVTVTKW